MSILIMSGCNIRKIRKDEVKCQENKCLSTIFTLMNYQCNLFKDYKFIYLNVSGVLRLDENFKIQ